MEPVHFLSTIEQTIRFGRSDVVDSIVLGTEYTIDIDVNISSIIMDLGLTVEHGFKSDLALSILNNAIFIINQQLKSTKNGNMFVDSLKGTVDSVFDLNVKENMQIFNNSRSNVKREDVVKQLSAGGIFYQKFMNVDQLVNICQLILERNGDFELHECDVVTTKTYLVDMEGDKMKHHCIILNLNAVDCEYDTSVDSDAGTSMDSDTDTSVPPNGNDVGSLREIFYYTEDGVDKLGSEFKSEFGSGVGSGVDMVRYVGDELSEDDILYIGKRNLGNYTSKSKQTGTGYFPKQPGPVGVDRALPILSSRKSYTAAREELKAYFNDGSTSEDPIEQRALEMGPISSVFMNLSRFAQWHRLMPDMCDAPPIVYTFFRRDCILDQVESFYKVDKESFFSHLFDINVRDDEDNALSISRYYAWLRAEQHYNKADKWVDEHSSILVERIMMAIGLDVDDMNMDVKTPIGLGNYVAATMIDYFDTHDGHMVGDNYLDTETLKELALKHNSPFTKPEDDDFKLQWQPSLCDASRFRNLRRGVNTAQTFVYPNLGSDKAKSVLFTDIDKQPELELKDPRYTDGVYSDPKKYIPLVNELIMKTSKMTEMQKMKAEFFNNKIHAITALALSVLPHLNEYTSPYEMLYVIHAIGEWPAVQAVWANKRRFFAPRPKTVMEFLIKHHADQDDVRPDIYEAWQPHLPAGDHPEFPSGSCAIFTSVVEVMKNFADYYGMELFHDVANWEKKEVDVTEEGKTSTVHANYLKTPIRWTYKKGSSEYHKNLPSQDTVLEWDTMEEYIEDCVNARMWSGSHFRPANDAGKKIGKASVDLMWTKYMEMNPNPTNETKEKAMKHPYMLSH